MFTPHMVWDSDVRLELGSAFWPQDRSCPLGWKSRWEETLGGCGGGKGDWVPVAGIKPEIRTLPFSSKHMGHQ